MCVEDPLFANLVTNKANTENLEVFVYVIIKSNERARFMHNSWSSL